MGLGREVADAYIEVHGDLSDFRKDLEKARPAMQAWAAENADDFMDGFKDRMEKQWGRQWNSIIDTMQSGTKLDFNRMVENFDLNDLDAASEKIHEMLRVMEEQGKISADQMRDTTATIDEQIKALQRQHFIEQDLANDREMWGRAHERMMAGLADAQQKYADTMDEAIRDNQAWAKTFEGIKKNDAIKRLNDDFEKLAKLTTETDWDKFAKGFRDYDEMAERIQAVTDAMVDQRRISTENADALNAEAREYIANMREQLRLMDEQKRLDDEAKGAALTRARLLREEQERYNASLEGMVRAAHFRKLEDDFRSLTTAIGTADFSHFGQGARTVQEFRDNVITSAFWMKQFGKIGAEEFGDIVSHLDKVSGNLKGFKVDLDDASDSTEKWNLKLGSVKDMAGQLLLKMSGTISHFKGLAGLNVFGDMIEQGIQIATNIDRVALAVSTASLKIGAAASLLITAGGGLVNVAADLGSMAGVGLLAPGFLAAAGIQIGVLVAAFKDMKTRLQDLGPQFSALQNQISDSFWKQAEQPVRRLVDSLMPTLREQLDDTATNLGGMFKALADGFTKNATPARVEGMFQKLNGAIKTAQGAMEPLTSAFVTLGEHASQYFGRFAEWMVKLSTDFDDFVTAAAKDGRLKKWTEDAIDAFKDTGRAIGGVFEIFQGINTAAEEAGIGGLKEFADSLERMADITKSPEFQTALSTYFEGAKAGADQIIGAINDRLFPALGNIAPTMSTAMDIIGQSVGTLIGYFSDVLENPALQEGLLSMVNGVERAVEKLEPAVKPFGDSLGSLLEIVGHIAENLASVIATFSVNMMPEIDKIGRKFEEMADPLTSSVNNAIVQLTPLISSLNTNVVTPLVEGVKKILPTVDEFIAKATPTLTGIVEKVGPPFKTLVEEVLPNFVKLVSEITTSVLLPTLQGLVELLTPAFGTALKEIGAGFKNMAEGMKALRGEANEFKWPWEQLPEPKADLRAKWGQPSGNSFWTDLGNVLFGGNLTDMGQRAMEAWGDDFERIFKGLGDAIADGWKRIWEGNIFGDQPGKFFREFFSDEKQSEIDDTVNQWFEDVGKNISDAWTGFWDSIFGGGQEDKSNSGGGHFAGRAVGGKITAEDLGLGAPDENWLEQTRATVTESINTFMTSVGDFFGTVGTTVKGAWDAFWGSLGSGIDTIWAGITTTISNWWNTITTNIQTWWTGIKTGWDSFWASLPGIVSQIWAQVTAWIQSQVQAIATNIGNFITTVKTGWDNFWNGVFTKVSQIWAQVTQWISTQVTAIATNISNFITTVRTGWDTFWNGVNQKVQQIWGLIVGWIAGKVGEISSRVSGFISSFTGSWNSFWDGVRQKVSGAWDQLVQAVSGGVDNVMGFIEGLPGQISAALGGLGNLLLGAGDAIMGGLKRGIESGFEAVKNVVGGIAGWIAENKGPISYDRVLLVPAGLAIMAGLRSGIEEGFKPLKSTLTTVTDALVDTVTEGFAKSRMYIAGAEAALGLADGLKSNAGTISSTFKDLMPLLDTSGAVTVAAAPVGVGAPTPGPTTVITNNFAEGAMPVTSNAKDPALVGSMVIETLNDLTTGTSNF